MGILGRPNVAILTNNKVIVTRFLGTLLGCVSMWVMADSTPFNVSIPAGQVRLPVEYTPPTKVMGPVVLVMHGCGGLYNKRGVISSRVDRMRSLLLELGFGVAVPDSYTPRGIKSTCLNVSSNSLDAKSRANDAAAVIRWLTRQKNVDMSRIGIVGWSRGADAALELVSRPNSGLRAAVLFYPMCRFFLPQGERFRVSAPTLLLAGEKDEWAPSNQCRDLAAMSGQDLFHIGLYPNAYYDFDAPVQPQYIRTDIPNMVPYSEGVVASPDPEAAQDAWWRTFKWFSRWFDPARAIYGPPHSVHDDQSSAVKQETASVRKKRKRKH